MAAKIIHYDCGVACIYNEDGTLSSIGEMLVDELRNRQHDFALVYFSKASRTGEEIATLMKECAPGLNYAGCSTAGEITPAGLLDGSVQVILFPIRNFHIEGIRLPSPSQHSIEDISKQVATFRKRFVAANGNGRSIFALTMMDGLSFSEEATTAAVHWGLDNIPLLGGSAGDDLDLINTSLVLGGEVFQTDSIVLLAATRLQTHIFKTDNFVPTDDKLVVTRSDPEKRIVHEFNAAPAATVFAEIVGVDPDKLSPQSFASHPLVMRVGGEYYCRSVQKVNEDNSLSFFCAVDDGIVLTVAQPTGMARSTEKCLLNVATRLGKIDFILGFDCVLRRVDARNRQVTQKIATLYKQNNFIGFNTYGEQYRSLHLNQTLTGIAFAEPGLVNSAELIAHEDVA